MASRPGPNLPYSVVAGCHSVRTWLARGQRQAATEPPSLRSFPSVLATFAEVLDERPSFSVIALNAPIGYVEKDHGGAGRVTAWLGPPGSAWLDGPQRAVPGQLARRCCA
jgi:hypothetical protein